MRTGPVQMELQATWDGSSARTQTSSEAHYDSCCNGIAAPNEEGNTMVTMSDVAKAAGVSRATASYALRGDSRITPATTEKVIKAAENLRYTANLSARSLRSGRNGVIAVAIFELDRPYPSQIAAAVSREAAKHDMQTIVQQTSNSKADEISMLRSVTSQLCDGIVFSPSKVSDKEIRALTGSKPIVLLDDISSNSVFDSVDTPNQDGADAAITHLLSMGHRNVLIIGASPQDLGSSSATLGVCGKRVLGCQRAFNRAGIVLTPDMLVSLETWDLDSARAAGQAVARSGRPIDAAFCMTDTIAIGFVRGLADEGISVPDDIAVVGFDGINEGIYTIPSLTTVKVDLDDLARKAFSLLLARIDGTAAKGPQRVTADFSLIERESTINESFRRSGSKPSGIGASHCGPNNETKPPTPSTTTP